MSERNLENPVSQLGIMTGQVEYQREVEAKHTAFEAARDEALQINTWRNNQLTAWADVHNEESVNDFAAVNEQLGKLEAAIPSIEREATAEGGNRVRIYKDVSVSDVNPNIAPDFYDPIVETPDYTANTSIKLLKMIAAAKKDGLDLPLRDMKAALEVVDLREMAAVEAEEAARAAVQVVDRTKVSPDALNVLDALNGGKVTAAAQPKPATAPAPRGSHETAPEATVNETPFATPATSPAAPAQKETTSEQQDQTKERGDIIRATLTSEYREVPLHGDDETLRDTATHLYAVIDGHGDNGAGKLAAQIVQDKFTTFWHDEAPRLTKENASEVMQAAFDTAHKAIVLAAQAGQGSMDMAADATAIKFFEDEATGELCAVVGHIGQSRLYNSESWDQTPYWITKHEGPITFGSSSLDTNFMHPVVRLAVLEDIGKEERFVLVTDGITGSTPEQEIDPEELKLTLGLKLPTELISRLIDLSKKEDDKSVIVIDVEATVQQPADQDQDKKTVKAPIGDGPKADTRRQAKKEKKEKRTPRHGVAARLGRWATKAVEFTSPINAVSAQNLVPTGVTIGESAAVAEAEIARQKAAADLEARMPKPGELREKVVANHQRILAEKANSEAPSRESVRVGAPAPAVDAPAVTMTPQRKGIFGWTRGKVAEVSHHIEELLSNDDDDTPARLSLFTDTTRPRRYKRGH